MTISSFQNCVGVNFSISLSQPSVSQIIHEMCNLIVKNLLLQYIIFPPTREEQNVVKQGYTLY